MTSTKNVLVRLWRDVRGISSVEYALLLAFIAVGIVTAAGALSLAVEEKMNDTAECISSNPSCT